MIESDIADFHAAFATQGWDKSLSCLEGYYKGQQEGKHQVFVATVGDEVAGYTVLLPQIRGGTYPISTPEICDFSVLEKYQRKGVGNAIMDAAEKAASEFSDTVALSVGLHSGYGAAQRIYVKRGYIPDGSGAWYQGKPHPQYAPCVLDDDLLIYMSKRLEQRENYNVEIREASLDDLRKIWDKNIVDNPGDDRWVAWADEYIGYNTKYMAKTFVINVDGKLVGEGTLLFSPECSAICGRVTLADGSGTANINALRNSKEYEGHGYVSQMVRVMEDYARNKGITTLTIGVEAQQVRNLAIYLHWGYTKLVHSEVEENELVLYYAKELK
jgi:GNAT superfamily N-acetyltransferase